MFRTPYTAISFFRGAWFLALSTLALVLAAPPAFAIKQCKLSQDPGSGIFRLKAKGVTGNLVWGTAPGEFPYAFSNDPACRRGKNAKNCLFDDATTPFDPAFPPPTCEFVVRDDSAQQCTLTVPACEVAPPRFEDCGDGTVADNQTGLLWEKKTGTVGTSVNCKTASGGCPDPHVVNNLYEWSDSGPGGPPNGNAYTDFLARLNGDPSVVAASSAQAQGDPADDPTVCLAHHCDWRLPAIGELRTILIGISAAPGQAASCPASPCIDPAFPAFGGPTAKSGYWSASSVDFDDNSAWGGRFGGGFASYLSKDGNSAFARAVRAGSCRP